MGKRVEKVKQQQDQVQGSTVAPCPLTAHPKDRFSRNFIWIVILGVLILFGIGRYTDYLETVIGLLGLGGIFAWVAFLFNVISKARKEAWQQSFENLVNHLMTTIFLCTVTVFVCLAAASTTCIIIDSGRDTAIRHIEIYQGDCNEPVRATNISPGTERRFLVFTGLRGRHYKIDAEGLPTVRKRIYSFVRFRVRVPQDPYRRCVVLIKPSPKLSSYAATENSNRALVVRITGQSSKPSTNDNEAIVKPFRGNTVWIGSDKELDIPTSWKERWGLETSISGKVGRETLMRWLQPVYCDEIEELQPKQKIEVLLMSTSTSQPKQLTTTGRVEILPSKTQDDFPQIIHIEQPK